MSLRRAASGLLVAGSTAITLGVSPAENGVRSGNDLLRDCKAALKLADLSHGTGREDYSGPMYCLGFSSGLSEGLRFGRLICISGEETKEQIARVVVKFLDQYPERLAEPEALLASEALVKAWPCRHPKEKAK